jgi:hypothetical protein
MESDFEDGAWETRMGDSLTMPRDHVGSILCAIIPPVLLLRLCPCRPLPE